MTKKSSSALRRLLFSPRTKAISHSNRRARLQIASLEDRLTPAVTYTVINTSNSAATAGSLPAAINLANADNQDSIIQFDTAGVFSTPQTISLAAAMPIIVDNVSTTIKGPGANNLTLQGTGAFRILDSNAAKFSLSGLKISGGGGAASGVAAFAGGDIKDMVFTGNTPTDFGTLYVQAGTTVNLIDSTISGNTSAGRGAGVFISNRATLNVLNSTISGNTSTGNGGAVFVAAYSSLTVKNSTISGNTSNASGGGIYFAYNGNLLVENSTISGNTASGAGAGAGGGGIYFYGTAYSVEVRNSTIANNTAANSGGGILLQEFYGEFKLNNVTVSGNTAVSVTSGEGGGGLAIQGAGDGGFVIANTVVANNINANGPDILEAGGFITSSYSLIEDATGYTDDDGATNVAPGIDPQLGILASNGGPAQTMVPSGTSPLIDVGNKALTPYQLFADQRGFGYARTFNQVDIGAVEVQPDLPVALASAPRVNSSNNGETIYFFDVTYAQPNGANNEIDVSSIIGNNGAILVTLPGGATLFATYEGIDNNTNGSPRVATYSFIPPGGAWDFSDNGNYIISVVANKVFSTDAVPFSVPEGPIGIVDTLVGPFIVTNTNDAGTGSLREAIDLAQSTPADDEITFDPSLFTSGPQTIAVDSSLVITEGGGGALSITGPGAALLTVKENLAAPGDFRVFQSFATELTMYGFTVDGGTATNASGLNSFGFTTLDHMAFTNNKSTGSIGGIFVSNGQTVEIIDSVISGNTAIGNGGGLQVGTGAYVHMIRSLVTGNTSTTLGAGIVINTGGAIVMEDSTVSDNVATTIGGGIFVNNGGYALLINSTVSGNKANGGAGGGIRVQTGGILALVNSTISGNTATTNGGGVYFVNGGYLFSEGSTISGNKTTGSTDNQGGGGINFRGTGTLNIRNTTIANNISGSSGGGILLNTFTGALTLVNATVSNNSAANANAGQGGGGIAKMGATGTVDLKNTIIAGNTATNSPDILSGAGSADHSAIGSTSGFTFTDIGGNLLDQTFVLSALADNGGPTQTMLPEVGGPLIDAGLNSLVTAAGLTTDQLGSTHDRIFGGAVDIGAYEVQPPEVTVEQAVGQADPVAIGPIVFDINFDANVLAVDNDLALDIDDIIIGGSYSGNFTSNLVQLSESSYQLVLDNFDPGIAGTFEVSIDAGVAYDATNTLNDASFSIDNVVTYDNEALSTITLEKAPLQDDPTNDPNVVFVVTFEEEIDPLTFTESDVVTSGSATFTSKTIAQVDATTYTVTFVMSSNQTAELIVDIPANAVTDLAGNVLIEAATSSDNSVQFDDQAPTVTVNQAATQTETGYGTTVAFDVVFNETVNGFNGSQLAFTGTATFVTVPVIVSSTLIGPNTYRVVVGGFATGGTVIASMPAGGVADLAGNLNLVSSSTDNLVTFVNSGTVQFSAPTYTVNEDGTTATITVSRLGGSEGVLSATYAITGGTATIEDDFSVTPPLSVTFADGVSTSQDIVITIVDDPDVETDETVVVELSNVTVDTVAAPSALGVQSSTTLTINDYEAGVFSFSTPTFNAFEGGIGSIVINRTGGTDRDAYVDYSFAAGTAELSDYGTISDPSGPISPSGTLHFLDGETSKTITIDILADNLSEGYETIDIAITNPQPSAASLGATTSAVLSILPSNPISLGAAEKFTTKIPQTDDQDTVTVKLTGSKLGTLNVYLTDKVIAPNDKTGTGPISFIEVTGTDTAKSTLSVTVTKPTKLVNPNADGKATIGGISAPTLAAIKAPNANLDGAAGPGVNIAEYLGALTIADVRNGADISFGAGTLGKQKTKLTLGIVENGSDITATGVGFGGISTLSAISFGDGSITANSADSITTKGRKEKKDKLGAVIVTADPGNFGADVSLMGASALPNGKFPFTLGKLTVAGSVDSDINVLGDGKVNSITVGTGTKVVADLDTFEGTLDAASVGKITVNGNLNADITLSGAGVLPGKPTLGSLKVAGKFDKLTSAFVGGTIDSSTITVGSDVNVGNITSVTAVNFLNSSLFAGYNDATNVFNPVGFDNKSVGTIGTFTVSGTTNAFANSHVFASTLKTVKLGSVKTDNGAVGASVLEQFGFTADVSIGSLKIGPTLFFKSPIPPTNASESDVDFTVQVI